MSSEWYHARAGMSENVLIDAFEAQEGLRLDRNEVVGLMRAAFLEEIAEIREIELITAVARQNQGRLPMAVASGGPEAIVLPSLRTAAAALQRRRDVRRCRPCQASARPFPGSCQEIGCSA
jgi:hypothetical protein